MGNLKRKAAHSDLDMIGTLCPFTKEQLEAMSIDYQELSPLMFAKKYRDVLFRASGLNEDDFFSEIQMNFCDNPFCNHYGKGQERFSNIKNKPYRYKLGGSFNDKGIRCNDIVTDTFEEIGSDCIVDALSNWSIAEEIKRLKVINSVYDLQPRYEFHKDSCSNAKITPFSDPSGFYKRGTSTGKSQKYQCKVCKKITNVLPANNQNHTYHQKKNAILPLLAKLLVSRTPVKRCCEILEISPKTYYHKLELLYIKCLEFLEKHETKALKTHDFDEIWLNTDKMHYYLNNIRRKGKASASYFDVDESKFTTYLVTTADVFSKYVFRSDIAYDYMVQLKDIEDNTHTYYDDHLYSFACKNDRLRFSYSPQPPTRNDTQSYVEYESDRARFLKREDYIEGMHVNSTYTTIAHCLLIKQLLGASKYVFISDDDPSIETSILRVFNDEIRHKKGDYFICKLDKSLDNRERYSRFIESKKEVAAYRKQNPTMSFKEAQIALMAEVLEGHVFHETIEKYGQIYHKRSKNFVEHPLPSINEGVRYLDCLTPKDHLSTVKLAAMLVNVNNHAVDIFYNQVRRRISILERPLVTATNSGKSYIYSNYNPMYAQYAVTILRTFYNFCWTIKGSNGLIQTPAQRIGISNKTYNYEDIIYFCS